MNKRAQPGSQHFWSPFFPIKFTITSLSHIFESITVTERVESSTQGDPPYHVASDGSFGRGDTQPLTEDPNPVGKAGAVPQ